MANLAVDLQIFNQIKERIAAAFDLEPDDEAVLDTATGECNLEEVIASVIRDSRIARAQAAGLTDLIGEMQARKERLEAREKRLREVAAWAMQESGLTKVSSPDFSISLGKRKPPVVTTREPGEGDAINGLANQRVTYSWDKEVLRRDLEISGGALCQGAAYLGNPEPVLTVRGR